MTRSWLHRHGIMRLINATSTSLSNRGTAYVETRGPRWLARRLAVSVVRHHVWIRCDWATIHVTATEHTGRLHYQTHLAFRYLR